MTPKSNKYAKGYDIEKIVTSSPSDLSIKPTNHLMSLHQKEYYVIRE